MPGLRFGLLLTLVSQGPLVWSAEDSRVPPRPPWDTSKITGSPDPPSPYRTERLYPKLAFQQPVAMVTEPHSGDTFMAEREGRIVRLPREQDSSEVSVFFDGMRDIPGLTAIYGLTFHPDFGANRQCFICYILEKELPKGTRVSRFTVETDGMSRVDPASEEILLEWKSGGHNGGCLRFGPDGFLYVSTGDASPPSPPDEHSTGQDISDLPGSILRIDVDRRDGDLPYAIPDDNPFVELAGARPEVWAYGLRNPWRMSFDRQTGDLWLGDVGWQLWEVVHRVTRGGNYGWSLKEGPQVVRPELTRGPTEIIAPVIAHPRSEAASVTGGFVYRGSRLKDLTGAYIYGDYVTGKIWALRQDGSKVTSHQELCDTPIAIIAFHEDANGEVSFMAYNAGTIHRLVPNESVNEPRPKFPVKLTETGLFDSVPKHHLAVGVEPFSINAEQWSDGATAERFVAIPGLGTAVLKKPEGRVPVGWGEFPGDTVLGKTISIETRPGDPKSWRRIETQILHIRGEKWRGNSGEWAGYSYVWNEDQTDATLAPADGLDLEFDIADLDSRDGGTRKFHWRVWSRSKCYACHNPWTGYRLAFTVPQLDRTVDTWVNRRGLPWMKKKVNQLTLFRDKALVKAVGLGDDRPLVNPHDNDSSLDDRARSYLHVNCAHCHRFGGGGTATIDLRFDVPLEESRMLEVRPTQGTFGISRAKIIQPAVPIQSVLYYRMSKLGPGRMPHIGSSSVDRRAIHLMARWISSLEPTDPAGLLTSTLKRQSAVCHSLFEKTAREPSVLLNLRPGADAIAELLTSTSGSLLLMRSLDGTYLPRQNPSEVLRVSPHVNRSLPRLVYSEVLRQAAAVTRPEIRDLFERFLPEDQRSSRLVTVVSAADILALDGNVDSGRTLFLESQTLQCRNCHRVADKGKSLGPDLTQIGKRLNRSQLLQSILVPSEKIDPKFRTWLVETSAGRVFTGLLVEKTDDKVVIRTSDHKLIEVPADEQELLVAQPTSLMPELQHRSLTAQQLSDLIQYLMSLK